MSIDGLAYDEATTIQEGASYLPGAFVAGKVVAVQAMKPYDRMQVGL
jgi:hypothetical protein